MQNGSDGFFITVDINSWFYHDKPCLNEGDELRIVLEPGNPYDADAIALYKGRSKVGYVPRDMTWMVHNAIDAGLDVTAEVLHPYIEELSLCPAVNIEAVDPYAVHVEPLKEEKAIDKPTIPKGLVIGITAVVVVTITAVSVTSYISAQQKEAEERAATEERLNSWASSRTATTTTTTTAPTSTATASQSNALATAKTYLATMPFSYSRLVSQLEYEGFSTEDATYAADNCGADWYAQAVGSAQSYLAYGSFSHSGLVEQLEYEGYTHEEAEYGVSAAGL